MKVSVISLGCKVNQAEGEDILAGFRNAGSVAARRGETSDVTVINTCTVTGEADRKSRKLIRKVVNKAATCGGFVIVTGCYAETDEEKLRQIPGVNLVVKQSEKDKLVRTVLREVASSPDRSVGVLAMTESPDSCSAFDNDGITRLGITGRNDGITRPLRDSDNTVSEDSRPISRSRAYLKIQDGCDNRCAYCIVPAARGRSRSIPPPAVAAKAEKLAAAGIKEIVLTGINIGKYPDLPGFIDRLLKTPNLARLRLSSIEPEDVTLELVGLLGEGNSSLDLRSRNLRNAASCLTKSYLCPHLHIPLQSGDDAILREMGRTYTSEEYAALVKRVRDACPGIAITTDVIVGLPGETEERFKNTIRFLEEVRPARLHVFKYSKRPGTPAATRKDQVPEKVKAERSEAVRGLGEKLAAEYRRESIGRELDVLVERASGNRMKGTSENYLSVSFDGESREVGRIVRVKLA